MIRPIRILLAAFAVVAPLTLASLPGTAAAQPTHTHTQVMRSHASQQQMQRAAARRHARAEQARRHRIAIARGARAAHRG
jgi:hypothetical protein